MKNIYNLYVGKNQFPCLEKFFFDKAKRLPKNPVILLFDNEQISKRPLKEFLEYIKSKNTLNADIARNIATNLFVATIPLSNGQSECEMKDLFDTATLSHVINGKTFCKSDSFDNSKYYGKAIFANYIASNYQTINFDGYKPILDMLNNTISNYSKLLKP